MPTTVQTMIGQTAQSAAARGMRYAIDDTLGVFLRPGIPEGIGFAVGFTILGVGLSVRARRRRLQRIEDKVDQVVQLELEQEPDEGATARAGRRERRLARQG